MERPGLKRLMADIEAGKIDVVVIHKIDRLTRSLADFSKMAEVFERQGVSFVSVTQHSCWTLTPPATRCTGQARNGRELSEQCWR